MRVMIDTNILDRLDMDTETFNELINRADILLLVTAAQEQEVAAISDIAKRCRLQGIMAQVCRRLALAPSPYARESLDEVILDAAHAAGCDLLVSDDMDLLNSALVAGIHAMDWKLFLGRIVWAPRK